jgi:hypothetical protein
MTGIKFRQFNDPGLLRSINPKRLREFLLGFTDHLDAHGFAVPSNDEFSDVQVAQLIAILNSASRSAPPEFLEAFFHANELNNDQGMESLLLAALKLGVTLPGDEWSAADLAMFLWIEHPEVVRRANCERIVHRFQSFQYYQNKLLEVPEFSHPTTAVLKQTQSSLDSFNRDRQRAYFTLRDARHTLATASEGTGLEGSIYAGLESLTDQLLGREWQRDDGAAMKIGRCLIDANWGHSTDVVYQFCRQSPHASILLPSHGRFVGASSNPFSEYKRRPGDRVGLNWRVPTIHGKRAIRHVIYDTNWWKSFTHARLAVAMGDRGCLSIFGDRPDQHRMFAEQVTAEYFVRTEGRGRTVDEWKARPEQPDNHWLDCLVGTAVAASMQGALLFGTDRPSEPKRARVSFKELQRRRRV